MPSPVVVKHRTLNFVYTNLDGISNKTGEFSYIVSNLNPDVICLTETKTSVDDANDHLYDCDNFVVYRKDRVNQRAPGGGVSILVNKNLIAPDLNVCVKQS